MGAGALYLGQGVTGRGDALEDQLHLLGKRLLGTQQHAGLHAKGCLGRGQDTGRAKSQRGVGHPPFSYHHEHQTVARGQGPLDPHYHSSNPLDEVGGGPLSVPCFPR